MNIEDKYNKLRAAVFEMVGVDDDPKQLQMMADILKEAAHLSEDATVTRNVLLVLIETHQ